MRRMPHLVAALTVAGGSALMVLVALALPAAAITGFQNGSFELSSGSPGYYTTICAGTSNAGDISGWTVTGGSVDAIGSFWTQEDPATNSLDMNGTPSNCPSGTPGTTTAAGTISQTFSTVPGDEYFVQFYLAGNPDVGYQGPSGEAVPATKNLSVDATGGTSAPYSFTNTSATTTMNMGWIQEGYTFSANSASTTLTFTADLSNTSYGGPAVDNVTITPIALTGAQCKDGGWQTMYDSNGNPFKNQGDCVSYFATSGDVPIGS